MPTRRRTSPLPRVCLVVPCYNEAQRLRAAPWQLLTQRGRVRLLFVDDGSVDATAVILRRLVAQLPRGRAEALILPRHVGRGEAVREGLNQALKMGYAWVGYTDADNATPAEELVRLTREVLPGAPSVVLGARVRRLGARVHRQPFRFWMGRMFARGAARALACDVYDTQCPAKFFRPSDALRGALREPFVASWVFDTELMARLLYPLCGRPGLDPSDFLEVPLQAWQDVAGSKLTCRHAARACADLMRIGWRVRRRAVVDAEDVIRSSRWRTWRSSASAAPPSVAAAPDAASPS